jgi:Tfp pilus assembly protein PilO
MRNYPLQRNLIVAGLGVLLAADVTLAYMTMRLSGSREERQQALAMETRRLATVKADVARATAIQKGRPEVLKRLDEFEGSLLPTSNGYSVVTKELDQFQKDAHVTVSDVHFHEKEVQGRNLTELEMEVAVDGDYTSIVNFLNKLQRSSSVYIIDTLQVESQNQGAVGALKVNLHLRTYFRKV